MCFIPELIELESLSPSLREAAAPTVSPPYLNLKEH